MFGQAVSDSCRCGAQGSQHHGATVLERDRGLIGPDHRSDGADLGHGELVGLGEDPVKDLQVGLLTGFSVLSVVELLYHLGRLATAISTRRL